MECAEGASPCLLLNDGGFRVHEQVNGAKAPAHQKEGQTKGPDIADQQRKTQGSKEDRKGNQQDGSMVGMAVDDAAETHEEDIGHHSKGPGKTEDPGRHMRGLNQKRQCPHVQSDRRTKGRKGEENGPALADGQDLTRGPRAASWLP